MPTLIAVAFIVILLIMIVVALGVILFEVVKEVRRFLEHRATSASWVSKEEPGLLDYEADGLRAMERFTQELAGLGEDTRKLGQSLQKHTQRIGDPSLLRKPKLRQKRANQAAKSIDRSAVYIEKRVALLQALVKDISRNFTGIIKTANIETEEDKQASQALIDTLDTNGEIVAGTIEKVAEYRDTVRSLHQQNPSRTVRIATKRLAEALEDTVKVLRNHRQDSNQLGGQLARRLAPTS